MVRRNYLSSRRLLWQRGGSAGRAASLQGGDDVGSPTDCSAPHTLPPLGAQAEGLPRLTLLGFFWPKFGLSGLSEVYCTPYFQV